MCVCSHCVCSGFAIFLCSMCVNPAVLPQYRVCHCTQFEENPAETKQGVQSLVQKDEMCCATCLSVSTRLNMCCYLFL